MGKKKPVTVVEVEQEPVVETPQDAPAPVAATPTSRGPRGVVETARITVLAAENPKRPGSKANRLFAEYRDGLTVGEFCDIAGKDATPHLVWDASHGFIAIEGYDPAKKIEPKAKAPKADKPAKAPKAKKAPKGEPLPDPDEALEAEAETIDE